MAHVMRAVLGSLMVNGFVVDVAYVSVRIAVKKYFLEVLRRAKYVQLLERLCGRAAVRIPMTKRCV